MNMSINNMLIEIEKLPMADKLELVEKVIHRLKIEQSDKPQVDWNELYGMGKGIWDGLDAQDYVNQLRAER